MNNIYLIQQFYIPNNKIRYLETKKCLNLNFNNNYIHKIILLNEKIYSNKELGFDTSNNKINNKILQINIKNRLKFKNVFEYVKNNNINGYIIFSNSDIFFNNTLNNIYNINLKNKRICLCQKRKELKSNGFKIKKYSSDSQDVWIYHSCHNIKYIDNFNFYFGIFGCDNHLAYYLKYDKFKLYNFPNLIQCIHLHKSKHYRNINNIRIKNLKSLHVKPIYFRK